MENTSVWTVLAALGIVIIGCLVLIWLIAKACDFIEWIDDGGISDLFHDTLFKNANNKKNWKERQIESFPCMTFEWWKDIFLVNLDRWRIGGCFDNPKCCGNDGIMYTIRFTTYDDWKQYRKFAAEWIENEKKRNDNDKAKVDLRHILEFAQRDIDAYKAKIDGEMDNAMSTCRDVSERIKNEIAQKGNVKAVDWNRYFAEWLVAYKRGETY